MDTSSRGVFGRMSGMHGITDSSLKQLVAWGDHLKVDQPQIDAQHEGIFNLRWKSLINGLVMAILIG